MNPDLSTNKLKSRQDIEAFVAEEYLVKHIKEIIHVVGSFDRFRRIVKLAISDGGLLKGKAMAVAQNAGNAATANNISGASQIAAPNAQPDTILDLQRMMKRVKDDIEKKMLGKDEDTNVYKAINRNKEILGGAIAESNNDNKE